MKKTKAIYNAVTGFVMGIAEVIPGVSGGTIAFVAGIYEHLLQVINEIRVGVVGMRQHGIRGLVVKIDWSFLISLFAGMAGGVVLGVLVVTHMLDNYPPVIWSFFFGLIVASCFYMGAKLNWNAISIALLLLGALLAYLVTSLSLGGGSESYLFVFVSGMIAIAALVLPGVSGSFMLLIMGMYTYIVRDTVKGLLIDFSLDKLWTLMIFGLGCLTGLFSVAKILQWAFEKYRSATIAILTGFMIGSLQKIWPWRNATEWIDKDTGEIVTAVVDGIEYKIIGESLVAPSSYDGEPLLVMSIVAFLLGLTVILLFAKIEKTDS
jgi:putative membrane protein